MVMDRTMTGTGQAENGHAVRPETKSAATPSITSGDIELLYETPYWYAAYTCANREKLVAAQLASRGVEHFLPLYSSVREWSDRRVKLQLPLFPGYLFVHTRLRNRLSILTVSGMVHLVGTGRHPIPLDTDLIERLRDGLNRVAAEPYPYLVAGQRVAIRSGPLKGLSGTLLRRRSGPRVVISIDAIQRSFLADVSASDLVPFEEQAPVGAFWELSTSSK
jgi:transcriptional antiterminator NusG